MQTGLHTFRSFLSSFQVPQWNVPGAYLVQRTPGYTYEQRSNLLTLKKRYYAKCHLKKKRDNPLTDPASPDSQNYQVVPAIATGNADRIIY